VRASTRSKSPGTRPPAASKCRAGVRIRPEGRFLSPERPPTVKASFCCGWFRKRGLSGGVHRRGRCGFFFSIALLHWRHPASPPGRSHYARAHSFDDKTYIHCFVPSGGVYAPSNRQHRTIVLLSSPWLRAVAAFGLSARAIGMVRALMSKQRGGRATANDLMRCAQQV
jgi:hypothetical protein